MRVAIIGLIPAPYREPVYHALDQSEGITLRVFYLQSKDSLRHWSTCSGGYEAVSVTTITPEWFYSAPLVGVLNFGLIRGLRRFAPDCLLIHGYSYLSQMQAMRWAIRHRIPYILCGDSNSLKLASRGPGAAVKDLFLRYFCRHAAAALTIGSSNERFWRHYGVEPQRQFRAPLAVDNTYFAEQARTWRAQKTALRQAFGLPAGRLLLFAGRLAPAKNLDLLLRGLAAAPHSGGRPISLALVGDGPSRPQLHRLIRQLGLTGVFQFDFQPQSELPKFYAIADTLVLPSRDEPWGLVVNEAMASGLPVLLSKSTGCLPDLLEEGGNGFSFDESDAGSIARCLRRFSELEEDQLQRMGLRSSQLIAPWSYSNALAGIFQALDAVIPERRRASPALSPV